MGGEASAAPTYLIPPRQIVAVEHPMIIENIDIGLKTFGKEKPFARVSPQPVSRGTSSRFDIS